MTMKLRQRLENELGQDLSEYGKFIDDTVLRVFAHMDRSSKILDTLFLGSEWNASNYEELKERNVGYILNVSNEIDNFFPADFKYMNIRVPDVDEAELIREWDKTFKFISQATEQGKGCLVHCKMGISRSAATVIAYLMKKNDWTLDEAFTYVHKRRSCVRPNTGFMDQLQVYEGILKASQVKRKLYEQSKDTKDCIKPTENPVIVKSDNLQCVLANGTDYLIKRFLESVHEYWAKRESKADTNGKLVTKTSRTTSVIQSSVPILRLTKPDQSWIRSSDQVETVCCRSSYSMNDLKCDNSPYNVSLKVPTKNRSASQLSGSVQRRIKALENRASATPCSFNGILNNVQSKPNNTVKLTRIQGLIRLYSFGLEDSKIAREVTAAFHKRLFNSGRRTREISG
ncbi:hypothetical protein GJ496_009237 [Pomphorhynchus laevis]|nr:hypothetical protein GJ496_009237 [Pomphorhynchus laevis]